MNARAHFAAWTNQNLLTQTKQGRFMTDPDHIDYANELLLVVDDEDEFGRILKDLLKHRGFSAHHLSSAADALEELRKNNAYTFLITDIVMPGMDGLELTRMVKKEFPDICIIAMTGYSEDYKYVSVVNAGATDFINKPFRIEELEAKIRRGIIERNTRQELKRLTITDSLTGLYNQRRFYSKLNDEIVRARRQEQNLALILLDLDDFKQYNDKYGHVAGDELLRKFGRIINAQIRQGVDSAFRYGGDEFAIILINADRKICRSIENRIAKVFEDECSEGVSMGYAIFENHMTPEDLVSEADKNLYKVKKKKK
ncbi:MAG: diguanylate cyclase response regulator [Deltaproteobacteria bacterium]|nr:MAG: diguanylate cyclase response regulator [Deltaproteobacteria bacterium]